LSGITEGKQALIGVIDTIAMDKELEERALLSARKKKPTNASSSSSEKNVMGKNSLKLQRRHSIGGADMQLILQNAAESSSKTEPALRRVDSSPTLRRNRSGGGSLQSSSLMTNTTGATNTNTNSGASTPLGSARRSSKDLGRVMSLSGMSNGPGSNADTPSSTPRNQPPSMSRQSSTGSDDAGGNAKSANTNSTNLEEVCLKRASKNIKKMPGRTIASIKNNPKYGIMDASSRRGITLITKHIALGGRDDANDLQKLRTHGISHVLNVAAQMPNFFPGEFVYMKIPMQDTDDTDVEEVMPTALDFIKHVESVNGRVLVHCISGVSRSTTVVVMHLMRMHKMTLLSAYNYVHSCRPFIEPNKGFRLQLAEAEMRQFRQSTVADKSAGAVWDFYEWNKKKEKIKIMSASNKRANYREGGPQTKTDSCLEWIVRSFM
jgi:protein-tyrosine phosphatase